MDKTENVDSAPAEPQTPGSTILPSTPADESTSSAAPTSGPAPAKKSRMGVLTVVLILVLAVAGAGAWYLMNKSSPSSSTVAPTVVKKDIPLLRYATTEGLITSFYPGDESGIGGLDVQYQVFEGLVGYQDKKIVPLLATKWSNPDKLTWVFTIKKDVLFHNGTKLTAQIVADSLNNPAMSTSGQTGFSSSVDKIVAASDSTVTITTKTPDALLLKRLVPLLIYDTTSATKKSAENGTGPYTVKKGTTPTEESIELVAFDQYHQGRPSVRAIEAKNYLTTADLLAEVKKGTVDVASDFNNIDAAKDLGNQADNYTIAQVEPTAISVLAPIFRPGSPILKKEVRQAIYMSIDPDKLIISVGGAGIAANQIVPKIIPGYDPTIVRPKYNVEAAKKLLATAGYPNGMTLNITYGPPAVPDITELSKELALIGITLKLNPIKTFPEFQTNIKNNTNDFWFGGYGSAILDLSDVVSGMLSSGAFGTYTSPEITAKLTAANQEFDSAKRLKALQVISHQLMDEVVWMPIRTRNVEVVIRKNLNATIDVPNGYLGILYWKVTQTP